jgi:hypothetical protein
MPFLILLAVFLLFLGSLWSLVVLSLCDLDYSFWQRTGLQVWFSFSVFVFGILLVDFLRNL